jgi:hypothetical protein
MLNINKILIVLMLLPGVAYSFPILYGGSGDATILPDGTATGQLLYWDGADWTIATEAIWLQSSRRLNIGNNTVTGDNSVVLGTSNSLTVSNISVIGGGSLNDITSSITTQQADTISGGNLNEIINSSYCVVCGGYNNRITGVQSSIPGGNSNEIYSNYSFAFGRNMILSAVAHRSYIFGYDSDPTTYTIPDTFILHAVDILQNSLTLNRSSELIADDGIISLPDGAYGSGAITIGDAEEYAYFIFSSVGAVTLVNNSVNVVSTDTDGNLCIFDAGSNVDIKNRLGTQKQIKININY